MDQTNNVYSMTIKEGSSNTKSKPPGQFFCARGVTESVKCIISLKIFFNLKHGSDKQCYSMTTKEVSLLRKSLATLILMTPGEVFLCKGVTTNK